MQTNNVEDLKSKFLVTIPGSRTKTKEKRVFTIVDDDQSIFLKLIRRYITLRPNHTKHTRFFVHYRHNKCTTNPVGINTFSKIPCTVAQFLKLDQPKLYTGHCFRRSSATILSDSGADFAAIKRHGGWKSTRVAESYIEDSVQNKVNIAKQLFCNETATSSTTPETSTQLFCSATANFPSNSPAETEINNSINSINNITSNTSENVQININPDVSNTKNLSVPFVTFNNCSFNSFVMNIQK